VEGTRYSARPDRRHQHSARFQQEARAIAALNHPHICQIHDIGPDYLVLEYIEGAPLRGPLALEEAVHLGIQIAGALEAAHAKGILHRDLKPGNIMMTASGAKLLDFGLAKLTADGDATQTIGVSGTPLYMSPEQAEGKVLDARSDIFSFGAVLYELLAGHRAFDSLAAVLRDDAKPLSSPAWEIVCRCLAKQPAQRFPSMAKVRSALQQLAAKPVDQQPSIAVLPFANMSGDKEQEYFSDGLSEEIINALTKVPNLKVTARTSAFSFRGKDVDIGEIARKLGVEHILEGSVGRSMLLLRYPAVNCGARKNVRQVRPRDAKIIGRGLNVHHFSMDESLIYICARQELPSRRSARSHRIFGLELR
jgi:serine/threonine protein kinase